LPTLGVDSPSFFCCFNENNFIIVTHLRGK
jgi:hypothetical protein